MSPKSILSAIVLMLMMVCGTTAVYGQNRVINFNDIENDSLCWQFLNLNPNDTLRKISLIECQEAGQLDDEDKTPVAKGDTLQRITSVYMEKGEPIRVFAHKKVKRFKIDRPVLDPKLAALFDSICVETRFAFDIATNPNLRYNVKWGEFDEKTKRFLRTDGKFVEKFGRVDGLNLAGLGAFQIGDGLTAFSGKGGVMYFGGSTASSFRYLVPVLAGATMTKYSDLAENFAGEKYWSFTSETGFYWQPFTFDRLDQLRLFIGGGVKFSWYQTDVQSHVQDGITHKVSSWGSSVTAMAGLYLTYRPKYQPWNFILGVHGYQSPEIRLNQDSRRPWVLNLELGVSYNLGEGFGNFTKKISKIKK